MADRDDTALELEVECLRTTDKAALFLLEDGEEKWIPLSVLVWEKGDVDPEAGAAGTIHVEGWFADKEGLR